MIDEVILVDEHDTEIGVMEKMAAHEQALLHRAFSVFIFSKNGFMLLQQRALSKYHSGGLWTNACCSHPYPNELVMDAAHRRLKEEMGFDTEIKHAFSFTYKANFDNGLTEHEFDHVFVGVYDGQIIPNPTEVSNFVYKSISEIESDIISFPDRYTAWFKIALPKLVNWMKEN